MVHPSLGFYTLSYQWTMLTVEASMFHWQSIVFSETLSGKNAEAVENWQSFQLMSVFQRSVTHSRVKREAHQAYAIKARVFCVRVCTFSIIQSLHCFGISVDLQNLVKIKCVP
jgi:hypothetical protein